MEKGLKQVGAVFVSFGPREEGRQSRCVLAVFSVVVIMAAKLTGIPLGGSRKADLDHPGVGLAGS